MAPNLIRLVTRMRKASARDSSPEDGQTGGRVSIETDEDRSGEVLQVGEKVFADYLSLLHDDGPHALIPTRTPPFGLGAHACKTRPVEKRRAWLSFAAVVFSIRFDN